MISSQQIEKLVKEIPQNKIEEMISDKTLILFGF